ncbi:MAG: hypothetical protein DRR16_04280 [Candidatus Parabeggiatoa sp. nov. 3]|nr:MAG: hypothetical protein DRR00_12375 [Gammaproteobacteria bacterium]RKZ88717.1 MAG: hypothetical protein DRR16_04280 [Gammaproteobacteria bacterium]
MIIRSQTMFEVESEEVSLEMGSLRHSFIQARMPMLLFAYEERFTTFVELSLDVSQDDLDLSQFGLKINEELKPDVCLYESASVPAYTEPLDDLIKVKQVPHLVIEILSPTQSIDHLLKKFKAYFYLGVQSCWLIVPTLESISVYSEPKKRQSFNLERDNEVIDEVLDIRLPLQKIFRTGTI